MSETNESQALAKLQLLQQIMESQKTVIKMTEKCFDSCILTPGASISQKEQKCLWNCAQRYLESSHFISKRSSESLKNDILEGHSSNI